MSTSAGRSLTMTGAPPGPSPRPRPVPRTASGAPCRATRSPAMRPRLGDVLRDVPGCTEPADHRGGPGVEDGRVEQVRIDRVRYTGISQRLTSVPPDATAADMVPSGPGLLTTLRCRAVARARPPPAPGLAQFLRLFARSGLGGRPRRAAATGWRPSRHPARRHAVHVPADVSGPELARRRWSGPRASRRTALYSSPRLIDCAPAARLGAPDEPLPVAMRVQRPVWPPVNPSILAWTTPSGRLKSATGSSSVRSTPPAGVGTHERLQSLPRSRWRRPRGS